MVGSSQTKSIISKGYESSIPASCKQRATSKAASTPTIPSNLPPASTVSICDPMHNEGPIEGPNRPIRFPAGSTDVFNPASWNC